MNTHKDLDAWKTAMEMAVDIYRLTSSYPRCEVYGLSSQMRRACVSVASNIAEGAARQSKKDYIRFLYCSLGSCAELETQLELSYALGYLERDMLNILMCKQSRVAQMLTGMIRRWKK